MRQGVLGRNSCGLARRRICADLRLPVDSQEAVLLAEYLALLEKWNPRINLTASAGWESIGPLFKEACFGAGLYPESATVHLDIGSGGGFPALPMKILRPAMQLTLVESRLKKAIFLETVIRELALRGAHVINGRLRDILESPDCPTGWDCISWKGIKLGRDDLRLLLEKSQSGTQFWMFHGASLPLNDPEGTAGHLTLIKRHSLPWNPKSYISIYKPGR